MASPLTLHEYYKTKLMRNFQGLSVETVVSSILNGHGMITPTSIASCKQTSVFELIEKARAYVYCCMQIANARFTTQRI